MSAQDTQDSTPTAPLLQPTETTQNNIEVTPTVIEVVQSDVSSDTANSENTARIAEISLLAITALFALANVIAVVAGFLTFAFYSRIQRNLQELESRVATIQSDAEKSLEAANYSMQVSNRYRLLLETKSQNADVRLRAIQQLGQINDISAISVLIETIINEKNHDIRIEAIYSLGNLLSFGAGEKNTTMEGVSALVLSSRDPEEKVRLYSIEALRKAAESGIILPVNAVERLRDTVKYDHSVDVKSAANTALQTVLKPTVHIS